MSDPNLVTMKQSVAWILVTQQFVLITLLVVIPQGGLWPTGLVAGITAGALLLGGLVVGVVSTIKLGKALTPNPIPRLDGHLETGGIYGLIRHPIYTAVLLAMLGIVVWGSSTWHLVFFLLLVMLLNVKARAEERLLLERYENYRDYARTVGRFVPGLGKITD